MNDLVRDGYGRIARAYAAERDQFKNDRFLEHLVGLLKPGSRVLDIGCGCGWPIDRFLLNRGFGVTGVDISPVQIELARSANPEATYEVRDMLDLRPGEYSAGAVVCFYTLFHAARETHAGLLGVMRSFLPEGGLLLITMGGTDWEGVEEFHGASMFWSHYGAEVNRGLVEAAGFAIELDELDTSGDERHQVLLARAR